MTGGNLLRRTSRLSRRNVVVSRRKDDEQPDRLRSNTVHRIVSSIDAIAFGLKRSVSYYTTLTSYECLAVLDYAI